MVAGRNTSGAASIRRPRRSRRAQRVEEQAREQAREAERDQAAEEQETSGREAVRVGTTGRPGGRGRDRLVPGAESREELAAARPRRPTDRGRVVERGGAGLHPPGGQDSSRWLLERVVEFLDRQPRLFRYLYLHEEFLFELGAALMRAGQAEARFALLRRLRREQPEMYRAAFGYYDLDLVAEALRANRREEIPVYLDFFREDPVGSVDQFAELVDLLAWRGCEGELRALAGGHRPDGGHLAASSEREFRAPLADQPCHLPVSRSRRRCAGGLGSPA